MSALLTGLAPAQQPADEKPAGGIRLRVGAERVLGIHHIHHRGLPWMLMLRRAALQLWRGRLADTTTSSFTHISW